MQPLQPHRVASVFSMTADMLETLNAAVLVIGPYLSTPPPEPAIIQVDHDFLHICALQLAGGLRAFVVAERRVEGNTTICFHIKVGLEHMSDLKQEHV